jgi:hypothetical protein
MFTNNDHDTLRKEIWVTAWCAVAASSNVTNKDVPASWANKCLRDFDATFGTSPDKKTP